MSILRNGSLSSKLGAPKLLKALDIVPDDSMDLSLLVEAHMPGMNVGPGGLRAPCVASFSHGRLFMI